MNKRKRGEESDEICSICLDDIHNGLPVVPTKCGHNFHEKCLVEHCYINKTCPLCRCLLYDCNNCKGTGYITTYHEGIVPPVEFRGNTRRQRTDGIYGIYDYYLEDLFELNFQLHLYNLD